jgi:hypothetical protein
MTAQRRWGKDNRPGVPDNNQGVKVWEPGYPSARSRLHARGSQPKQARPDRPGLSPHSAGFDDTRPERLTFSPTPARNLAALEWVGDAEYVPVEQPTVRDGLVEGHPVPARTELPPELVLDLVLDHWRLFSWGKLVEKQLGRVNGDKAEDQHRVSQLQDRAADDQADSGAADRLRRGDTDPGSTSATDPSGERAVDFWLLPAMFRPDNGGG